MAPPRGPIQSLGFEESQRVQGRPTSLVKRQLCFVLRARKRRAQLLLVFPNVRGSKREKTAFHGNLQKLALLSEICEHLRCVEAELCFVVGFQLYHDLPEFHRNLTRILLEFIRCSAEFTRISPEFLQNLSRMSNWSTLKKGDSHNSAVPHSPATFLACWVALLV